MTFQTLQNKFKRTISKIKQDHCRLCASIVLITRLIYNPRLTGPAEIIAAILELRVFRVSRHPTIIPIS